MSHEKWSRTCATKDDAGRNVNAGLFFVVNVTNEFAWRILGPELDLVSLNKCWTTHSLQSAYAQHFRNAFKLLH